MTIDDLLNLYDHMAWADAKMWAAVLDCEAATYDVFLQATLRHMHTAQLFYLRAWRGEPHEPLPDLEEHQKLLAWARPTYDEARAYVQSLTDEQVQGPMPAAWMERMAGLIGPAAGPVTLADTMAQVPVHTGHHRGQVSTRLRELGGRPPLVDYVVWVWSGRPGAEWPEEA